MHVIIHGPHGCGKTRNADKLAAYFGCQKIVDAEDGGWSEVCEHGHRFKYLILTNAERLPETTWELNDVRVVSFEHAMSLLERPERIPGFLRRSGSFGGGE